MPFLYLKSTRDTHHSNAVLLSDIPDSVVFELAGDFNRLELLYQDYVYDLTRADSLAGFKDH